MTVGQLVAFAAELCESDPKRMIAIAEKLGLCFDDIRNRVFVKLSGGEKQKMLISIALGRDCKVLVMDEPAANLDPEARQVLFSLLAERKDDTTMIISSHRLDEVAALVNRVVELDQGLIILDDEVDDEIDMASLLLTSVKLTGPNEAFAKAIMKWNFTSSEGGAAWSGKIAGPDRLRFLGVLSRYAGLLCGIEMKEASNAPGTQQEGDR